ncbi:MAG: CNNM domain-containing protein [Candidatus Omnitrophota bacterium]
MIYLYLLSCLIFVILQGFFAASEISFISSPALKLRHRQNKGDRKAGKVYEFILNPHRFLVTTLVGTNISLVLSTSFLTFFLINRGLRLSNLWITFIFTPIVVIFAELIPKNIGRFLKEDFSCQVVGLISFFEKLFLPIVKSIEAVSKFLVKIFARKAKPRSFFVTKEEIKFLVKEIEKQGGIDRGEKEAIEEVFEFRRERIKDVCVRGKKIIAFDYADSYKTILATVKQYRFTRYPVYSAPAPALASGRKDGSTSGGKNKEIIGYVNIYDLFYQGGISWQQFIRPIVKVGFNHKLHKIFTKLKSQKESIALVLKGRKIYGIITIQDITREIVTSIIKA